MHYKTESNVEWEQLLGTCSDLEVECAIHAGEYTFDGEGNGNGSNHYISVSVPGADDRRIYLRIPADTKGEMQAATAIIKNNKNLTSLTLKLAQAMDDRCGLDLVQNLKDHPNLKRFRLLRDPQFPGTNGAIDVCIEFLYGKAKIEDLYLEVYDFSDLVARNLSDALRLKTTLSSIAIINEGFRKYSPRTIDDTHFFLSLFQNKVLHKLELAHFAIGLNGVLVLSQMNIEAPELKSLRLIHTEISSSYTKYLDHVFESAVKLEELSIDTSLIPKDNARLIAKLPKHSPIAVRMHAEKESKSTSDTPVGHTSVFSYKSAGTMFTTPNSSDKADSDKAPLQSNQHLSPPVN